MFCVWLFFRPKDFSVFDERNSSFVSASLKLNLILKFSFHIFKIPNNTSVVFA